MGGETTYQDKYPVTHTKMYASLVGAEAACRWWLAAMDSRRRPGLRFVPQLLLHLPASRWREVVLLGLSRDTRTPGAASLGMMAEAALVFAGDGRPEDGVVGLTIHHRVPATWRNAW
jgi:hypothetical protein